MTNQGSGIRSQTRATLRRMFPEVLRCGGRTGEILVQAHSNGGIQLAGIFFAIAAQREFKGRIQVFNPRLDEASWTGSIKLRILRWIETINTDGILAPYGAISSRPILQFRPTRTDYLEKARDISTLNDLQMLAIQGVHVGDLIYDEYLKRSGKPTIDISSTDFQTFLLQSLDLTNQWFSYFDTHAVSCVIGTAPYFGGIPIRIAASRNIPSFEVHPEVSETRSFSREEPYSRHESRNFPRYFRALPKKEQDQGIQLARERMTRRLSGNQDPLLRNKVQWEVEARRVVPERGGTSNARTFLVATHDFFDAAHAYGVGIFPDYFSWLTELGRISRAFPHRWLLKVHPDSNSVSDSAISEICAMFPKFEKVDRTVANWELLKRNPEAVFTCHGTVGKEFAYLGLPVVNCHPENPHQAYSFNIHIQQVQEIVSFCEIKGALPSVNSQQEVLECFFIHQLWNVFSYFHPGSKGPKNYWQHFLKYANQEDAERIVSGYQSFITSGEYWMLWRDHGRETAMNREKNFDLSA